jgi:hypothetical protein
MVLFSVKRGQRAEYSDAHICGVLIEERPEGSIL